MNKKMIDRRQDIITRSQFDKALIDLSFILPCYTVSDRFKVFIAFFNSFDYAFNDNVKGRILSLLKTRYFIEL